MAGCEKCFGTGSLDAGTDARGVPLTKPCVCQIIQDYIRNLNHAWANLALASKITSSPLAKLGGSDLYITATDDTLRSHLKYVGLHASPYWFFRVITDSDLMTAWLSPAMMVGKEVLDPDAASVSSEKATLVDLVDPPELMILRLGVKSARNSAMGEVLLEALKHRAHEGKPTWVVDQPTRRFDPSHLAFNEEALQHIQRWEHIVLDSLDRGLTVTPVGDLAQGENLALSGPPALTGQTRRFDMPTAEVKKPKSKRKGFGHDG